MKKYVTNINSRQIFCLVFFRSRSYPSIASTSVVVRPKHQITERSTSMHETLHSAYNFNRMSVKTQRLLTLLLQANSCFPIF